jgi:hypothetical protein
MLIDDRNVVALPERVKLSPEREQDAAAIAAPVPMPPVATSGMATRARTNCSRTTVQRSETLSKQPAIGLFTSTDGKPWPSTPRGSSMGLIANDRQRGLGVAPAAGSLLITMYKSDWQISGKWRLETLRPGTGRVLDPAWPAVSGWSPRRNRTGDPILTMNHQEPLCGPPFPLVALDRRGRSYRFSFDAVMRSLAIEPWW